MNDDYRSLHDLARRDELHSLYAARRPTNRSNHEPAGSWAGVVCCLCWDFAESLDGLHAGHTPHRVPGTPESVVGCCPDHDVRSRHWIATHERDETQATSRAIADGGSE